MKAAGHKTGVHVTPPVNRFMGSGNATFTHHGYLFSISTCIQIGITRVQSGKELGVEERLLFPNSYPTVCAAIHIHAKAVIN